VTVVDWLLDPFSGAIGRRALVEVILLGLACGPLGVWIVLYRRSYAAESISHGMLPGLVLAALAGVPLLLGAAGGVLLCAATITLVARDERLGGDVGVAVAVTALFGLGAMLALAPAVPPRLEELLFGDLLGVSSGDLMAAGALAAAVAVALAVAFRPLSLVAFDAASARSLGAPPGRWQLALLALLAVTTVVVVQGLGSLLVVALILAPGAAALNVTGRLPAALGLATWLAALAGAAGLVISHHLAVAAGASVALCAVAEWVLSLLAWRMHAPSPPSTALPADMFAQAR